MKKSKPNYRFDIRFLTVTCLSAVALLAVALIFASVTGHGKGLILSEVMSANDGVWSAKNASGAYGTPDYVEIYNSSEESLNLRNFGLSDRSDSVRYLFPEIILEPGAYYVIPLGDKTGFSLNSRGGEELTLTNSAGTVLDRVTTVQLEKNEVMLRDPAGEWTKSYLASPGFANTEDGQEAYIASINAVPDGADLVITEVLPCNKGNFSGQGLCESAALPDFIEVKNVSDHAVDLAGYFVSDSVYNAFDKVLGEGLLEPGASYAYFDVGLSNTTGTAVLSYQNKIVGCVSYSDVSNGHALVWEDGEYRLSSVVSPGFENTAEGVEAFQKKHVTMGRTLVINEVVNSVATDEATGLGDWIEFYNNSGETVSLSEYYLSTNKDELNRLCLGDENDPDRGVLEPGGFYVFYTDVDLEEDIYLSKLADDGLILTDSVFVSGIPKGKSYARGFVEGWFFALPTPGEANQTDGTCRTVSATPWASVAGGIYNNVDKLSVELSAAAGAKIYYTTDGSEPTVASACYAGPIVLTKTGVLHAVAVEEGKEPSALLFQSYVINENHTMPVVSVTMDPAGFSYLYNHPDLYGLRLQSYVEYYDGETSFAVPAGIGLFGDRARSGVKKAFSFRLDDEWGQNKLYYPLFENRDAEEYNAFVLRCGSTQANMEVIRDIVGTSLVDDYTDIDVTAYKPVIVYVNGRYYGIYNMREKVNRAFIKNHYHVEADDLDIVRIGQIDGYKGAWLLNGRGEPFKQEADPGTADRYNELRTYAKTHDMTSDEAFEYLSTKIDMVNFTDYWIAESYVANNDIINVRVIISDEIEDGKMHMIFYDLDNAWYWAHWDYYTRFLTNPEGFGLYNLPGGGTASCGYENDLIRCLLKNPKFRELWLERLAIQLETTWRTENVLARIDEIAALYEPEIQRDRARWGFSLNTYYSYLDALRTFAKARPAYLLSTTKSFFHLTDAEMEERFGKN